MSSFRRVFRFSHVFLAVVHAEDKVQALRNARIAADGGAGGIFLINHHITYNQLFECYRAIRERLPDLWIGLNCLDLGRSAIEVVPKNISGLWVDDTGVKEDGNVKMALEFRHLREKCGWQGIYFGGVAFKYQEEVVDVGKVAKLAVPFVDVVTTSGEGTGLAPSLRKIRAMKNAIGDHPLAIASGITSENVEEYMPHCDCFLVATGVSDSHTELNPDKVRTLARKIGR